MPPPEQCPEPGYYYHYKHDPNGPLNNYAYYIYGVGHHTEDDCRPEDAFMQVYRPLYETAYAYRNGGMFDLRPLYMFHKPAIVNGVEVPARLPASKSSPPRDKARAGPFRRDGSAGSSPSHSGHTSRPRSTGIRLWIRAHLVWCRRDSREAAHPLARRRAPRLP